MNSVEIVRAIQALISLIKLVRSLGVDVANLIEMQNKAEAEGRELTDDELKLLAHDAQEAINRL